MVVAKAPVSEARERVLNSAYDLFVQSGYTDVSMQQIADAAAITKATLYHHFRDKQDLYIETMSLAIDRSHRYFREQIDGTCDLREILRELVVYHFGTHKTDMQRLGSDFRRYVDEETQQQFWQRFDKPWDFLSEPISRAIARGDVIDCDTDMLSRYLFGAIAGVAMTHRFHGDPEQIEPAEVDYAIDLLLRGLSPDAPTAAQP